MKRSSVNRSPAPRPEFVLWPAYALCLTASTLPVSDELPGGGEALERMQRALSPRLESDLETLNLAGVTAALPQLMLKEGDLGRSVDRFLAWVSDLPPSGLAQAVTARSRKKGGAGTVPTAPRTTDGLAEWRPARPDAEARERVRALLKNPRNLREFAVSTLTTLWEEHVRAEYVPHVSELAEAASVFGSLPSSIHPADLLSDLVKRPIPRMEESLAGARRLLVVPLPYLGPYIVSHDVEDGRVVAFDGPRALRLHRGLDGDLDLALLKVLADDTRLRILRFVADGERFGGDIVAHLGIAQPGVSRHLRLMVASGLLHVRQEGTAKHYSVNAKALDAVAHRLLGLARARTKRAKANA